MNDFSAMEQRLGKYEWPVVKQELYQKMRRAEMGRLVYGPDPEHDVMQMAAAKDVLEIRLSDRGVDTGSRLHIRFFFSEPLDLPGSLIGLGVMWKRPGPIGVGDQTDFAVRCSARLREYSRRSDFGN